MAYLELKRGWRSVATIYTNVLGVCMVQLEDCALTPEEIEEIAIITREAAKECAK